MTCELGYSSLVNNHLYREQESRSAQQRKRNILYLIENYLRSENLSDTLCSLQQEARLLSEQYTLCDNVDLPCIVQEYEDYYFLRFNKHPKLTKPVEKLDNNTGVRKLNREKKTPRVKPAPVQKHASLPDKGQEEVLFESIVITPAHRLPSPPRVEFPSCQEYPEEWKPFIEIISQEIVTRDVNTHWSDVIGLESAKQLLHEAIVYPIRYPELFRGLLSPWRGNNSNKLKSR